LGAFNHFWTAYHAGKASRHAPVSVAQPHRNGQTPDSFALILRGCGRLQMEREGCHFGQAAQSQWDEYELFGIKFNQF
jgi:hypothetical protein